MQFHFTEEQQAFADSVRRFALAHLEKGALKRAHDPRYPFDVAKLMSAQGLMGISQPDAGSAATDLKTSAKPDGSHYVINGSKVFSTFSPDAAIFLIYVRYGPGLGGIGSVIVERGTPGFAIGQPSRFMSGEEWCELHFDDCRIPAENVLLGPGGFKKQMAGFNIERLGNTARSLAFGRYAFNKAREHAS